MAVEEKCRTQPCIFIMTLVLSVIGIRGRWVLARAADGRGQVVVCDECDPAEALQHVQSTQD